MAGYRHTCKYQSYNGFEYVLEIWDANFSGTSTACLLGTGGPVIEYASDSDDRFSAILASTMRVPFVVRDEVDQLWINSLRTSYEEQELYAHLYRDAASGRPLWSGYLLMDLSGYEDKSYPYDFELKFTDGLSLLKERDFVESGTSFPYSGTEVYWGPAEFTYWFKQLLGQTGAALTTEGAGANWEWITSVNWFNRSHQSATTASFDPLANTKCMVDFLNTTNDNQEYVPPNCYQVLKEMLRHWGCRIVYWDHIYWIVQIPEYNTAESGTYAAPINLTSRQYNYTSNTPDSSADDLTNQDTTPYELLIDYTDGNIGIKKLSYAKFNYLPPIRVASADFIALGNNNFFNGFPDTTYPAKTFQHTIVDADNTNGFILSFSIAIKQTRSTMSVNGFNNMSIQSGFLFYATNVAHGGSDTLYLNYEPASGVYTWTSSGIPLQTAWPYWIVPNMTGPQEQIFHEVFPPAGVVNPIIPTDAAFTGPFDFYFQSGYFDSTGGNSTIIVDLDNQNTDDGFTATGLSIRPVPNPNIPVAPTSPNTSSTYNYNNQITGQSAFLGYFCSLDGSNQISSYGENFTEIVTGTNSEVHDFGTMIWGDSAIDTADAALQVYNGTNWLYTNVLGYWGVGTIAGTFTFTELLMREYLKGQISYVKIANMKLVIPKTGKTKTDGSAIQYQYINPVGRIVDDPLFGPPNYYVFKRGKFSTEKDEWSGDWFEIKSESVTSSSTSTTIMTPYGPMSPMPTGGSIAHMRQSNPSSARMANITVGSTSARLSSGAQTSISIFAIGTALLNNGDKCTLIDGETGERYNLTLAANQGASDTSLTIDSYDFPRDVMQGSVLTYQTTDLISQYQNKTTGTIAGMPVDSDELGCIKYDADVYTVTADVMSGVDMEYIKINPADFIANEDGSKAWNFDDDGTTGVKIQNANQELWAFVNIPYNRTATHVTVYGNGTKDVEVYELDVSASGIGSAKGTGTVGTEIDITDVASSATNYLGVRVMTDNTANRIYGGKVTLIEST